MNTSNSKIKKIQLIELDMLKAFVNVCAELKLKYFLAGGTLLGAIRHNGFIPWDDDIDVIMPREDYEKFLEKGQALLEKKYFIQNYKTDPEFVLNFTKIRNSETTFIEKTSKNRNINHGIYIDIFPLDGFPRKKVDYIKTKIFDTLYGYQVDKYFFYEEKIKENFFKHIAKKIFSDMLYRKKSLREIQDKKEKMYKKYKYTDSENIISYCGMYGKKEIMPKKYFGEGKKVLFEGIEVIAPQEYDLYLKQFYGDYMKLPPKEQQVTHHYNEIIDLENSYKKYIGGEKI